MAQAFKKPPFRKRGVGGIYPAPNPHERPNSVRRPVRITPTRRVSRRDATFRDAGPGGNPPHPPFAKGGLLGACAVFPGLSILRGLPGFWIPAEAGMTVGRRNDGEGISEVRPLMAQAFKKPPFRKRGVGGIYPAPNPHERPNSVRRPVRITPTRRVSRRDATFRDARRGANPSNLPFAKGGLLGAGAVFPGLSILRGLPGFWIPP